MVRDPPVKDYGHVEAHHGQPRARVQLRAAGAKRNIYGPSRADREAAKNDLAELRDAAVAISGLQQYVAAVLALDLIMG